MAAFKIPLCVVVLVSFANAKGVSLRPATNIVVEKPLVEPKEFIFANAEDVSLRPITEIVIEKPLVEPKETRATVIGSNLSANEAIKIANDVQAVYDSISGASDRGVEIQNQLKQRFPSVYNNVFINFEDANFYQRYYVHVYVNGENVLGFGF